MDREDAELNARAMVRLMAGLCVALGLMCLGLAVAYGDKARQVRCYAEAADLGLVPPRACEAERRWTTGVVGRRSGDLAGRRRAAWPTDIAKPTRRLSYGVLAHRTAPG